MFFLPSRETRIILTMQEKPMIKTRANLFTEEVNGMIFGGDHLCGQLFYDGRPQGPQLAGDDMEELKEQARREKKRWLDQTTPAGWKESLTYPDDSLWELRVFN